jgi:hypothetical protein
VSPASTTPLPSPQPKRQQTQPLLQYQRAVLPLQWIAWRTLRQHQQMNGGLSSTRATVESPGHTTRPHGGLSGGIKSYRSARRDLRHQLQHAEVSPVEEFPVLQEWVHFMSPTARLGARSLLHHDTVVRRHQHARTIDTTNRSMIQRNVRYYNREPKDRLAPAPQEWIFEPNTLRRPKSISPLLPLFFYRSVDAGVRKV